MSARRKYPEKLGDDWKLKRREEVLARQRLAALARNCSACSMPSTSGSLVKGRCHVCSEDLVADLKRRIRLARDIARSRAFVERGHYRDELMALLDLRKRLPKKGRR